MKKFFKWFLFTSIGIMAFECVLSFLHIPYFTIPIMIGVAGAVFVLSFFGKMYFAQVQLSHAILADRRDERRANEAVSYQHEETTRQNVRAIAQISGTQQALVAQLLGMGATLDRGEYGGYAAYLPEGYAVRVEGPTARYWAQVAPETVAKQLPEGSSNYHA